MGRRRAEPRARYIEMLAPIGGVRAGEIVWLPSEAELPFWPFKELAALIPGGDVEQIDLKLNRIYLELKQAEWNGQLTDSKETRRRTKALLAELWKVERPAIDYIAAGLRIELEAVGVPVPEAVRDPALWATMIAAVGRAKANVTPRVKGSPGRGAPVRTAIVRLVELHHRETGTGRPYKDGGAWRRLDAAAFALGVLRGWHLAKPGDTPATIAGVWSSARPSEKSGTVCPN